MCRTAKKWISLIERRYFLSKMLDSHHQQKLQKKINLGYEMLPRSVMKRPSKNIAIGLCEVFLRIHWICSLHVWVRQTHTRQCLDVGKCNIYWVVRLRSSHHQDYEIFLGSGIPINLDLPLLLGGGTTQNIYTILSICMLVHKRRKKSK